MTIPLSEFMKSWTYREYLVRLAWLEMEYDKPSRTDYYLMQIAAEVRRVLSKKPKAVKMAHFLLSFGKKQTPKYSKEQVNQMAKNRWLSLVGESVNKIVHTLTGAEDNGKDNDT